MRLSIAYRGGNQAKTIAHDAPNRLRNAIIALVLSSFVLSGAGTSHAGQTDALWQIPDKAQFHLFLLAGQSNMAGRGKVTAEDRVPIPRVLMLNKDNQWVPAVAPLHFDKPVAGTGIGRAFAKAVAARDPDIVVGLIPCAAGGSPIASWEPGGFHKQTNSHPYDDAVKRAKIAMQRGTLKAILWHQGESDSKAELAGRYAKKLHGVVARFRADLGIPNLPFIVGQLGQFPDRPWTESRKQVDAAHRGLPQQVAQTAFVSSDGLVHRGDKVHFDRQSLQVFGKRFADAYFVLASAKPTSTSRPPADPHLVAWWKLDERTGTTATDASGHQHHGTLKGGLTFEQGSLEGRDGRALALGGKDQRIEVVGYKGVTGVQPRTLAMWIKTKRPRGDLLSWGEDDAGKMWIMRFIRGHVGVTPSGGYLYMHEKSADDRWHHVAAVITGGNPPDLYETTKIYVDGAAATIDDIGLLDLWPIETGAALDVRIGNGYQGVMDDIRIYDRALSADEIKALHTAAAK